MADFTGTVDRWAQRIRIRKNRWVGGVNTHCVLCVPRAMCRDGCRRRRGASRLISGFPLLRTPKVQERANRRRATGLAGLVDPRVRVNYVCTSTNVQSFNTVTH